MTNGEVRPYLLSQSCVVGVAIRVVTSAVRGWVSDIANAVFKDNPVIVQQVTTIAPKRFQDFL